VGDIRHATRMLGRTPGFSLTAILILALAIAGNTAAFSAVDVFLLEPLPFADGDRLVVVSARHRTSGARAGVSTGDYREWSAHATTLAAVGAAHLEQSFNVSGIAEPVRVTGGRMTASLLPALGVAPLRGRRLLSRDEEPGAPPAVLITEPFWERRFGRSERAVGSAIVVDGVHATIVGVLPSDFRLLYGGYSVWMPLVTGAAPATTGERPYLVIARLAETVTAASCAAELEALARGGAPSTMEWMPRVVAMRDFLLAGRAHTLWFVITALAVLLLVACANTASLQLARAAARQQEIATRLSLGASRWRVVRQLLGEAGVIAGLSAAVALGFVAAARRVLLASSPDLRELQISPLVLGFTLLLTLATAIAFGLVPALTGTRMELAAVLKGTASSGRSTRRLLSALVVVELASSLALLVPAGLLFKSFRTLRQMHPGFAVADVLTFSIVLPSTTYPDAQHRLRFQEAAIERLGAMAGVRAVAASDALPLDMPSRMQIEVAGAQDAGRDEVVSRTLGALTRTVSADYFRALAIPLLAGRAFDRSDSLFRPRVAIVNDTLARTMEPDGRVLGATIRLPDRDDVTIVGVVADLRSVGMRVPPQPEVMLPLAQHPTARVAFAIAAAGDTGRLAGPVREAVLELDADLPLASLRPMADVLDEQVAAVRVIAGLLGALALLALLLASAGLSGLMSRLVAQRTREFGIRAALGATRADVLRLVLRDAAWLVGGGLLAGLPVAIVAAHVLSGMLWGVRASDLQTFGGVAAVLALAAFAACYVPARRAARLDPAAALRGQ
jgi:putative ABC transport system permease protein